MNNEYYGVSYQNRKKIEGLLNIFIEDGVQDWELEISNEKLSSKFLSLANNHPSLEAEFLLLYIYSNYEKNDPIFNIEQLKNRLSMDTYGKLRFYFNQVNDVKAKNILECIYEWNEKDSYIKENMVGSEMGLPK